MNGHELLFMPVYILGLNDGKKHHILRPKKIGKKKIKKF